MFKEKYLVRFIFIFLILIFSSQTHPLTLDLEDVNLSDAIHSIAALLNLNVIISSKIKGTVTVRLQKKHANSALNLLLSSNGLGKWRKGNIWFIAPQQELINRKQEEFKWQTLVDETAPLTTMVWQIQYGRAIDISHILKDEKGSLLSNRGHLSIDSRTNIICVQDTFSRIERIQKLIKQLDVPIKQILIETRLVSVDTDFERELGVDFAIQSSQNEGKRNHVVTRVSKETRYSLAMAKLADGSILDIKLSALENAGHAELISSPALFTEDQQSASIEAGEEVPYQEISESGGTAVVFKKAVLGLKVTPHVLPRNRVLLDLKINQDRPSNKMVLGVPTISTRQIKTNVLVKSGQTIVLGGIYETSHENAERGIPFLQKIPLLGLLFRQQNIRSGKRELLIFVTPKIIDG